MGRCDGTYSETHKRRRNYIPDILKVSHRMKNSLVYALNMDLVVGVIISVLLRQVISSRNHGDGEGCLFLISGVLVILGNLVSAKTDNRTSLAFSAVFGSIIHSLPLSAAMCNLLSPRPRCGFPCGVWSMWNNCGRYFLTLLFLTTLVLLTIKILMYYAPRKTRCEARADLQFTLSDVSVLIGLIAAYSVALLR
jgi:hypothetical protein